MTKVFRRLGTGMTDEILTIAHREIRFVLLLGLPDRVDRAFREREALVQPVPSGYND
jgi:hypothetical protein